MSMTVETVMLDAGFDQSCKHRIWRKKAESDLPPSSDLAFLKKTHFRMVNSTSNIIMSKQFFVHQFEPI